MCWSVLQQRASVPLWPRPVLICIQAEAPMLFSAARYCFSSSLGSSLLLPAFKAPAERPQRRRGAFGSYRSRSAGFHSNARPSRIQIRKPRPPTPELTRVMNREEETQWKKGLVHLRGKKKNEDGDYGFAKISFQMLGTNGEASPPIEALSLGFYCHQSVNKVRY